MPSCWNPKRCYLHNCCACLKHCVHQSAGWSLLYSFARWCRGRVGKPKWHGLVSICFNPHRQAGTTSWLFSDLLCNVSTADWLSNPLQSLSHFTSALRPNSRGKLRTFSCTKTDDRWHHGLGMLTPLCTILSGLLDPRFLVVQHLSYCLNEHYPIKCQVNQAAACLFFLHSQAYWRLVIFHSYRQTRQCKSMLDSYGWPWEVIGIITLKAWLQPI